MTVTIPCTLWMFYNLPHTVVKYFCRADRADSPPGNCSESVFCCSSVKSLSTDTVLNCLPLWDHPGMKAQPGRTTPSKFATNLNIKVRVTNSYHLKEQVLCLGRWARCTNVESHRILETMQGGGKQCSEEVLSVWRLGERKQLVQGHSASGDRARIPVESV